jgi:anti-sigma regulatory factor (Ser/Thr protein kinase)
MIAMPSKEKEIVYLNSFSADTSVVPTVIDKLIKDLKKMNYPSEDIEEIILSMDESITNAIQETIKTNQFRNCHHSLRDITIRYKIDKTEFDATVIDHGNGLDIFNILEEVPDDTSDGYHEEITKYASKSESKKLKVTVNGKDIPLKGIGVGLKIILSFMDNVTIDLIDKKRILAVCVSEDTDGTILNMKRKIRYKND